MNPFRGIPLSIHAGLEILVAPALMVAPFVFGFGQAATIISVLTGAILLGLTLQIVAPERTVPLRAHANLDYALATFAIAGGLASGLITGNWTPTIFLVGIGVAMVALTASTRFSLPRGA